MKIESSHLLSSETDSLSRTRQLGSYYTPDTIATAVAKWAVRTGNEIILEPSAGGGALLLAAFQHTQAISNSARFSATAYDVDPLAIKKLNSLKIPDLTVRLGDFLAQEPNKNEKFDLVLANPPFNRNHSISFEIRERLRKRFGTFGALGLWGHFLLHSLNFLRIGGRLASIVPHSILFTKHGEAFLKRLCSQFKSVQVCDLSSRPSWSNFADEAGAVILSDGFGLGVCEKYVKGRLCVDGSVVVSELVNCESQARISENSVELSTLASLSIGVVTGRNKVFLLNEAERHSSKISFSDVCPAVSRSKQLSGITLNIAELRKLAEEGHKTWLLAPTEITKAVEIYLKVIPQEERNTVVWFKKRKPWWKVQVATRYDAVFTYMNDIGPRIIMLAPGIVCTNTLHRVVYHENTTKKQKICSVLTPISTFGQLEAEKIGRSYGGGVLKFELSEARRIPVVISENFTESLLIKVDALLKSGQSGAATAMVDEAFMPLIFGESWKQAKNKMLIELENFRNLRRSRGGKAS